MEEEIIRKLDEQSVKIEAVFKSVEKTRKYFLWSMIITIAMIALPLVGLAIAIPWLLKTLTSAYGGLL
ncbi:MAG: hypothetical protein Q7S18_01705 [bacterium]|nr:hypothetical protein [bacterium]